MSASGKPHVPVPSLGRPLELGMFYNCRDESFIAEKTLWSKDIIHEKAHLEECAKIRQEILVDDSFTSKAKSFSMEPAIKLSLLSNLLTLNGSAKYLEDTNPSHRQVRVVLWYHSDTFVKTLKTSQLSFACGEETEGSSATHVIVGVEYGFDAFFVFDRELKSTESCEVVQKYITEALSKIVKIQCEEQMPIILTEDEQKELDTFVCTFYSDISLINPPLTFEDAIRVHRELPKMLQKVVADGQNIYGIPKTAQLCPLKESVDSAPMPVLISETLVDNIITFLETISTLQIAANDLMKGNTSCHFPGIQQQIQKFEDTVSRFKKHFRHKLFTLVPAVRRSEIEEDAIADYIRRVKNSPFDTIKLSTWLEAKKHESLLIEVYLDSLKDCMHISQEKELDQILLDESVKHTLTFSFGSIAASSHPYLEELENAVNDLGTVTENEENFSEHWHDSDGISSILRRQADLFSQFASINKENTSLKCVVLTCPGRKTSVCTPGEVFLYIDGSRKSFQPPSPPGAPAMLHSKEYEIEIQWDAPANGTKGIESYSVAYQEAADIEKLCWTYVNSKSKETNFRITQLKPDSNYVFKVAALCKAGKSEYSSPSAFITTKALPSLAERYLEASFLLSKATNGVPAWYLLPLRETYHNEEMRLRKYEVGMDSLHQPHTKVILIVGATGSGKTTLVNGMINYLFGTRMEDDFRLKLINEELQESQAHSQTQYITAYTIHFEAGLRVPYALTIVDTPGYGDTRGIAQDDHVTKQIKEFFEMKGENAIDHIDAVGFVAQASAVRLTDTQKYVFDAILSIFGRNISSNIFMMLTFADGRPPPAMDAINAYNLPYRDYFKFNNSVFTHVSSAPNSQSRNEASVSINEPFDTLFWQLAEESFSKFFQEFSCVKSQSLKLTKEVLEERRHLEVTIESFQSRITSGVNHLIRIREEMLVIEQFEAEKTANKQFTRTVQVPKTRRVPFTDPKRYVTNCLHCNITCHKYCNVALDDKKYYCSAMKNPRDPDTVCGFCTNNCSWKMHVNRNFYFEEYIEEEVVTIEELKKKYDQADQTLSEKDNLLAGIYQSYSHEQMLVIKDIETVRKCLQRLDRIAMKRNPMTTVEYIDVMIQATKNEKKNGWQKRLMQLQNARQRASMIRRMEIDGIAYDPFIEFKEELRKWKAKHMSSKGSLKQKLKSLFGF